MTSNVIEINPASGRAMTDTLANLATLELARQVMRSQAGAFEADPMVLCTCTLATRLGPATSPARLVDAMARPAFEFSDVELVNTLAGLGFRSERLHLAPRKLDKRLLPALQIDQNGAPRVILDITQTGTMLVFDPSVDQVNPVETSIAEADACAHLVVFPRLQTDRPWNWDYAKETRNQGWARTQFSRFSKPVLMVVGLGFILNLLAIMAPLTILITYQQVIGPQTLDALGFIAIFVLVALSLELAIRKLRLTMVAWVTSRLDFIIGTSIFQKLINLPPSTLEKSSIASQLARIKSFEAIRDFFAGPVVISVLELPAVILSLVVIFLISGPLTATIIAAALVYVAVFLLLRMKLAVALQEAALENSKLHQFNLETLAKIDSIRADGLEDLWQDKHRDLSSRTALAQHRLYCLGQLGEQIGAALAGVTAISVIWFGTHMIWAGTLNTAALIAVVMLGWRALSPFQSLCALIPQVEQARFVLDQINQFMALDRGEDAKKDLAQVASIKGQLDIISATLRYNDTSGPIFMGLNMSVAPGQIVAIHGSNGSGKSSILKMVLGFQKPLLGSVRLDGYDLRQIDGQSLRRHIGYVPQTVTFMSLSIKENLLAAAPMATDSDLNAVLELAGAKAQIAALPDGMDTQIGAEMRGRLGDLLFHRLALARALLSQGKLLLIDEQPGSVLRSGFDADLRRVLTNVHGTRTVLFVTHRADFLRQADKILTLKQNHAPKLISPDQFLGNVA